MLGVEKLDMNKMTAFLFAIITLIAGFYLGYICKDEMNTDMLLGLLMVGNALLTVSTVKGKKE